MKRYKKEDPVSYALGITLTFEMLEYAPERPEVYAGRASEEGRGFRQIKGFVR